MSKPVPTSKNSGTVSGFDTPRMHSSIDREAISAAPLSAPTASELHHFESADRVLERLRRRVGQLYGTTDYDQTLSRVGLILITLEACIARLNLNHQAIHHSSSLMAIIHEIDKCCVMIEHETKIKKDEQASLWFPLIKLLEHDNKRDAKPHGQLVDLLVILQKQNDKLTAEGKERFDQLTDQLNAIRDIQLSENRKLFASLSALHATIERCVDRLSRVEYGLMEARSIETSSAIADWPQSMQSVTLSCSEGEEPPALTIDPRRALAAARGGAKNPGVSTDQKKIQ